MLDAAELWEQILDKAGKAVNQQSFKTWIESARGSLLEDGTLQVTSSTSFHAAWLEDRYGELLREIAADLVDRQIRLRFDFDDPDRQPTHTHPRAIDPSTLSSAAPDSAQTATPTASPAPTRIPEARGLNDRYTFDRFVVGENTALAQAACSAVAERPARSYNPLFLYGATGMGKTHLMHAIANRALELTPGTRVCYLPAEQFVNEMVTAISTHTTDRFRARYRSYDLLLVDDVQFLRRKEHTQEEFFHTFNVLYNGQRQIVLSSDRPPKDLEGLEDRLVSRFEWGLVVAIDPADYETRLAILRRKAEEESISLPSEVLDLIARRCTASVRQLEGAILKLVAISSVTNRPVSVALARTALADANAERNSVATPELICELVADSWNTTLAQMESPGRARSVVEPRQVAMYLIRELLGFSYAEIGSLFGGRDHSTVMHSIRKIKGRQRAETALRSRIFELRKQLKRSST